MKQPSETEVLLVWFLGKSTRRYEK